MSTACALYGRAVVAGTPKLEINQPGCNFNTSILEAFARATDVEYLAVSAGSRGIARDTQVRIYRIRSQKI